jgi:hypothetical protein
MEFNHDKMNKLHLSYNPFAFAYSLQANGNMTSRSSNAQQWIWKWNVGRMESGIEHEVIHVLF